ncbi:putative ubiquitin [Ordospora pajunii]|uniref:putative ubiquitin n=1 Tax=Ordospora pajunii TaxID=3039483 RepID=UPI0029527E0B|nr:putative ubiquitin [Ordospora pajunii]KAH9411153.1 putative ubiquitin [Ordospora pajunii]
MKERVRQRHVNGSGEVDAFAKRCRKQKPMARYGFGEDARKCEKGGDSKKIVLRLKDPDGTVFVFKAKRNVAFRKVLEAFSNSVQKSSEEFRMLFKGKNLDLGMTPDDLGLSETEDIEVFTSQEGGNCLLGSQQLRMKHEQFMIRQPAIDGRML